MSEAIPVTLYWSMRSPYCYFVLDRALAPPPSPLVTPAKGFARAKAASRGPSRSSARAATWFPARYRVRDDSLWGCASSCPLRVQ